MCFESSRRVAAVLWNTLRCEPAINVAIFQMSWRPHMRKSHWGSAFITLNNDGCSAAQRLYTLTHSLTNTPMHTYNIYTNTWAWEIESVFPDDRVCMQTHGCVNLRRSRPFLCVFDCALAHTHSRSLLLLLFWLVVLKGLSERLSDCVCVLKVAGCGCISVFFLLATQIIG